MKNAADGIPLNCIVEEAALYEEASQFGVCYCTPPPPPRHSIMELFREGWLGAHSWVGKSTEAGSNRSFWSGMGRTPLRFVQGVSCRRGRWIDSSPTLSSEATGLVEEIVRGESESGRRNYFPLVLMHSVFCEVELQRLLLGPARTIATDLIEVQVAERPSFDVTDMEAWSRAEIPGTLGITGMVVCGLRWGLRQMRPAIMDWVQTQFAPSYQAIISNRALSQAIEAIRGKYRNPACHGQVLQYSKGDYEHLAKLVVGTDSLASWHSDNSEPCMNAGEAVLHNHLVLKRGEETALETQVSSDGFAKCPWCGNSFPIGRKTAWDGVRHVSCGAPLHLVNASQ